MIKAGRKIYRDENGFLCFMLASMIKDMRPVKLPYWSEEGQIKTVKEFSVFQLQCSSSD